MEGCYAFPLSISAVAITLIVLALPVDGQDTSLCTGSMLRSFTPCMNFATNLGGSSPTADCCNSLRYLTENGTDCLCLIATGGVPFRAPIDQTLVLSLPKACKMPGVPIVCRGSTSEPLSPPLAPDGNSVPGLTPPEGDSGSGLTPSGMIPGGGSIPRLLPPGSGLIPGLMPPDSDLIPRLTPPGTRPTLSSAHLSIKISSPILLLAVCGAIWL